MSGWDYGKLEKSIVTLASMHNGHLVIMGVEANELSARRLVKMFRERHPEITLEWRRSEPVEPDKVWFDEVADFGSFDPRWNGVDHLAPVRRFTRDELSEFFPSQTLTEPDMSTNNRAPQGRAVAGSKMGRRLNTSYYRGPTGRYANPNVSGEKELARGPRFYMEPNFPNGSPRSAPTLCLMSKKDFRDNVVYVES